jgi:hypothetical protein
MNNLTHLSFMRRVYVTACTLVVLSAFCWAVYAQSACPPLDPVAKGWPKARPSIMTLVPSRRRCVLS